MGIPWNTYAWPESETRWFGVGVYFSSLSHSSATCIVIQWLGGFFVDRCTDVKKLEGKPVCGEVLDLSGVWYTGHSKV